MRLRRHCYDKPWRCPGWAGGGFRFPSDRRRICDGGTLVRYWDKGHHWLINWQFHRCEDCGTVALPIGIKWMDPAWLWWRGKRAVSDRYYDWRFTRELSKREYDGEA